MAKIMLDTDHNLKVRAKMASKKKWPSSMENRRLGKKNKVSWMKGYSVGKGLGYE